MDTQTLDILYQRITALEKKVTFLSTLEKPKETIWYDFTLLNGWSNYGSGFETAQYYRSGQRVYLKGLITGGTTTQGTILCTLPVGFRPQEDILVSTVSNHVSEVFYIQTNGDVVLRSGSHVWFSLTASFRV